jgi:hypothetical protein
MCKSSLAVLWLLLVATFGGVVNKGIIFYLNLKKYKITMISKALITMFVFICALGIVIKFPIQVD